ncbi:MAG: hypothetical protein FJY74_05915 [Candidatus Eisenbacteria bacterium]|nr:hypothetical protein [Candidatus Eisenbacteria bacterium]
MAGDRIGEQLSLIRATIERSKRETAESGWFLIWAGLLGVAAVLVVGWLEAAHLHRLVLPTMGVLFGAIGAAGYVVAARRARTVGARSYPAAVCRAVWCACAVSAVIALFLLPALRVYPWSVAPVLGALLTGLGVCASGVIFETPAVAWSSLAWWGGAVVMAVVGRRFSGPIMAAVLLFGMVLPGVILNGRARRSRGTHEG